MIDIKPLRYFVVLAETLHFGKAAARLHLSQPPLSRQLAALEEALGVKLLERDSRKVSLTAAGERFHADARAILAAVEQAASNAHAAAAGELGTLTIGFTMCAAYSVVPRYARSFTEAWPDVKLRLRELVSSELIEQIGAGHIDAAIMFPGTSDPTLASQRIHTEPLCVALPASHPLACSTELKIDQLAGEAFVMAAEDAAPSLRAAIVGHCQSGGFSPEIRFEVQLQQTVLSLVSEGVGLALVPTSMSRLRLDNVVFRPLSEAPNIELLLVWSAANLNPCLQKFIELLASTLASATGTARPTKIGAAVAGEGSVQPSVLPSVLPPAPSQRPAPATARPSRS